MKKDLLIQQFIANEAPFFIITDGRKECIGKNEKTEDIDAAARRLEGFLSAIDQDSRAKFTIYCFEQLPEGKLKGKVKDVLAFGDHDYLFTWSPYEAPTYTDEEKVNWRVQKALAEKALAEKIDRIEAALIARQIEDSDDDEEIEAAEIGRTHV
mgnify:CR=1 FL=1